MLVSGHSQSVYRLKKIPGLRIWSPSFSRIRALRGACFHLFNFRAVVISYDEREKRKPNSIKTGEEGGRGVLGQRGASCVFCASTRKQTIPHLENCVAVVQKMLWGYGRCHVGWGCCNKSNRLRGSDMLHHQLEFGHFLHEGLWMDRRCV